MNDVEKIQFGKMQEDIKSINNKIDKLYTAVVGSDISQDGGLVGRIQQLEQQIKDQEKEMQNIKNRNVKTELYMKLVWALVGATGLGILNYILKLVFGG